MGGWSLEFTLLSPSQQPFHLEVPRPREQLTSEEVLDWLAGGKLLSITWLIDAHKSDLAEYQKQHADWYI